MNERVQNILHTKGNILASFSASFVGVMLALPLALSLAPSSSPTASAEGGHTAAAQTANAQQCGAAASALSGETAAMHANRHANLPQRFAFATHPSLSNNHSSSTTSNNSSNNSGANSQIGKSVVGVSTAVNDLVDLGDINTNVLNNNDVLSNNNVLNDSLNNDLNHNLNNNNNLSGNKVDVDVLPIVGLLN